MTFTSLIFLFVFFPLCIAGYYLLCFQEKKAGRTFGRIKDIFLILSGLAFYGWASLDGILILAVYVVLVWAMGVWIGRAEDAARKKRAIAVSVIVVTAVLLFYKYYNFGVENINRFLNTEIGFSDIAAPLGISFITFSAVSYLVDIYRGDAAYGNLIDAGMFLTFFPKVVSGPIVQWKDFDCQIKGRKVDSDRFLKGLNRIMTGFAKKLILADTFGTVANDIAWYGEGIDQPTTWICAFFYMMQIYYDFAGYSDIAIGLSGLFGFEVKENFNFPYMSLSISEFWRRWHISLGTWFREYIYIPLGGNRKGKTRTLINLFTVFLLTGFWHGAGWNYILWGILNGVCVVAERCIRDNSIYKRIPKVVKWAVAMCIVYIGWIFFRIQSVSEIVLYFQKMVGVVQAEAVSFNFRHFLTTKMIVLSVIAVLGATVLSFPVFRNLGDRLENSKAGLVLKEAVLFLLMILAVICMVNSSYSPFIYFQY